jgi:hypothetical protein
LIDSQNLYINRLLNKHKKQKQYSLGSPIVMLPVTVTIETKRQWKCLLCVYCLSDICIWITQIYILYTLRILVWYFTNSVFESSKSVWISHRNLYDYSMKVKLYLANFRMDNDEINVRLKLWSKTADLFTHEYYELRKFVTEF